MISWTIFGKSLLSSLLTSPGLDHSHEFESSVTSFTSVCCCSKTKGKVWVRHLFLLGLSVFLLKAEMLLEIRRIFTDHKSGELSLQYFSSILEQHVWNLVKNFEIAWFPRHGELDAQKMSSPFLFLDNYTERWQMKCWQVNRWWSDLGKGSRAKLHPLSWFPFSRNRSIVNSSQLWRNGELNSS